MNVTVYGFLYYIFCTSLTCAYFNHVVLLLLNELFPSSQLQATSAKGEAKWRLVWQSIWSRRATKRTSMRLCFI